MKDDFYPGTSSGLYCIDFDARSGHRHHDDGFALHFGRRKGYALGMVSGRESHNAACALVSVKAAKAIKGPAKLK